MVIAPAGPVEPALLDHGVAVLRDWGLQVDIAPHVRHRHPRLPYLAGSDPHRAADLQQAWCDPSVDAVLCARGGYGTLRILDLLDWDAMRAAPPKIFVGSSDLTAMHDAIRRHLGLATLFGPMVAGVLFDEPAQQNLRRTLFEPEHTRRLTGPATTALHHGTATGTIVGGNLSLITAALAAQDSAPPPDGAILLLEDVDEPPYRIDRMLTQLLRAGYLTGISGIALGSWTACGDPTQVHTVITDLLGSLGIPTLWELGFGHCPAQLTIPLGVPATLDAGDGTLTLTEPALT